MWRLVSAALEALFILSFISVPAEADQSWCVQVSAFRETEKAESMRTVLSSAGYPAYIAGGDWIRVRIGPYPDRETAAEEAEAVRIFMIARFGPGETDEPWIRRADPEDLASEAPRSGAPDEAGTPGLDRLIEGGETTPELVTLDPAGEEVTDEAAEIIALAESFMGTPYVWAGESPEEGGFDCSGFVNYIYGRKGYRLPRSSANLFDVGQPVSREDLAPGDIVFFTTYLPGPSHTGIYIGDGNFIHSSSGAGSVVITPLSRRYYRERFLGGRRIIGYSAPSIARATSE